MPPTPRLRKCSSRTKAGLPCERWALPGKKNCATHIKRFGSKDPEKKARQLANLQRGRPSAPKLTPDEQVAKTLADYKSEIEAFISDRVRDADGNLPPAYTLAIEAAAHCRADMDATRRGGSRNKMTLLEKQQRQMMEWLSQLGLTPKTHREMLDTTPPPLKRVVPVQTEERAKAVADLLLRNCALPVDSAIVAVAREAKEAGLTFLEVVAMRQAAEQNGKPKEE